MDDAPKPAEEKSPPSVRNKTIFEAIGIEGIFIAIVALVIVGILSYLNIIPLGKFFSFLPSITKTSAPVTQKGFLPASPAVKAEDVKNPTPFPNLPANIQVVSENPAYVMTLQNKDQLISLLRSWVVFARTYPQADNQPSKPIENIIIHLTSTVQPKKSQVLASGETITSYNITISGNTLNFYVYVAPNSLTSSTEPGIRGGFVVSALLRTLYALSHQALTPSEAREKELGAALQKELPKNYLLITAK